MKMKEKMKDRKLMKMEMEYTATWSVGILQDE